MLQLLIASTIWGLSFGLIGNRLAGLDPAVISCIRLALSLLVVLPFGIRKPPAATLAIALLALGALQFGIMYLLYIASFGSLKSHEVALFTLLTPLHVALLGTLRQPRQLLHTVAAALLAVAGAAAIWWQRPESARLWHGFLLVQASNLCFAVGQLLYRRLLQSRRHLSNLQALTWMYAGATLVTLPFAIAGWQRHGFAPDRGQLWILLYLGVIASGVGFWLWNSGARTVRHSATLAVMNNAKIPIGIALSLLLFKESSDLQRLLLGSSIMVLALLLALLPSLRPPEQRRRGAEQGGLF